MTDLNGNIAEMNDACTRITGYNREEAVGRHSHLIRSGDRHAEDFYNEMSRSIAETGRWRGEQWLRRKDGSAIEISSTLTTVYDFAAGKRAHYVALFFDITPIREQQRRKLAPGAHYYDDLHRAAESRDLQRSACAMRNRCREQDAADGRACLLRCRRLQAHQ